MAVSHEATVGRGQTIQQTTLVPVKLTLLSAEERQQLAAGCTWSALQPKRGARLLEEAHAQGGVLSFTDVALLTGMSVTGVSHAVQRYYQAHPEGEALPHMGTVFDLGRTLTHTREAVLNWLPGLLTQENAHQMHHHPDSVEHYVRDFQRVFTLWLEGKDPEQMVFLRGLAASVVQQYLALIEEHAAELRTRFAEFDHAWAQAHAEAATSAS